MKAKDDLFDIEKLRLGPEDVQNSAAKPNFFDRFRSKRGTAANGEKLAVVPRKIQKQRKRFIIVPRIWDERLLKARYIVTYRVAHYVLYRSWETRGEAFTLSNGAMAIRGISPRQKWRALRELEVLGLITIERRKRKTPRITVITTMESDHA
jgi:hypothetical protein